jgi:hypothetical protein
MIKKLRNQPYVPKWEKAPKREQRGRKEYNIHSEKYNVVISGKTLSPWVSEIVCG